MNSHLAERIDADALPLEASTLEGTFAEIEFQYGPSRYGKERYGGEELHWMGHLYRYWAYVYRISSARIYKIAPARDLQHLYQAYHTLDPAMAIERIAEAQDIAFGEKTLEDQVEALRKIRAELGK